MLLPRPIHITQGGAHSLTHQRHRQDTGSLRHNNMSLKPVRLYSKSCRNGVAFRTVEIAGVIVTPECHRRQLEQVFEAFIKMWVTDKPGGQCHVGQRSITLDNELPGAGEPQLQIVSIGCHVQIACKSSFKRRRETPTWLAISSMSIGSSIWFSISATATSSARGTALARLTAPSATSFNCSFQG